MEKWNFGANDGVKRGDGSETGDNEARPTGRTQMDEEMAPGEEDLTIRDENDPDLGLTDSEDYG